VSAAGSDFSFNNENNQSSPIKVDKNFEIKRQKSMEFESKKPK